MYWRVFEVECEAIDKVGYNRIKLFNDSFFLFLQRAQGHHKDEKHKCQISFLPTSSYIQCRGYATVDFYSVINYSVQPALGKSYHQSPIQSIKSLAILPMFIAANKDAFPNTLVLVVVKGQSHSPLNI